MPWTFLYPISRLVRTCLVRDITNMALHCYFTNLILPFKCYSGTYRESVHLPRPRTLRPILDSAYIGPGKPHPPKYIPDTYYRFRVQRPHSRSTSGLGSDGTILNCGARSIRNAQGEGVQTVDGLCVRIVRRRSTVKKKLPEAVSPVACILMSTLL